MQSDGGDFLWTTMQNKGGYFLWTTLQNKGEYFLWTTLQNKGEYFLWTTMQMAQQQLSPDNDAKQSCDSLWTTMQSKNEEFLWAKNAHGKAKVNNSSGQQFLWQGTDEVDL